MKRTPLFILFVVTQLFFVASFGQERVVVLGSSTAAGTGATVYDSSWVGRLQLEYRKNTAPGNPDTIVTNLAVGGTTTYYAMPTGYTPPPGRPLPDPDHNVTKALSFMPSVIIINFPTNDIGSNYTPKEYMDNLRYLYQYITTAGVKAYIATTQPRSQFTFDKRQLLRFLVDSINNNFGLFAINFWDDLVTSDGQYNLRPEVNSGDGVHVNNLGHRLLFQRVRIKNIFTVNAPLPLTLVDFKVQVGKDAAQLTWQTANEEINTVFEVQRSADGVSFETLVHINAKTPGQGAMYSWTDNNLLPGKIFYRLKIVEPGKTSYSKVVSIAYTARFSINKMYASSSTLTIQLLTDKDRRVNLRIINLSGAVVAESNLMARAPAATLTLPILQLASGEYFIMIESPDGKERKAFAKFH